MRGQSSDYTLKKGLGIIDGCMCPHYNLRKNDFLDALKKGSIKSCFCVENDCAIEFVDGKFTKSISSGGKAYFISKDGENIKEQEI